MFDKTGPKFVPMIIFILHIQVLNALYDKGKNVLAYYYYPRYIIIRCNVYLDLRYIN